MLFKNIIILAVGIGVGVLTAIGISFVINFASFNDYVKFSFQNETGQAVKYTEVSYDNSKISGPSLDSNEGEILVFKEFSRTNISCTIKAILADGRTLSSNQFPTHNGDEWEVYLYSNQIVPSKTRGTW